MMPIKFNDAPMPVEKLRALLGYDPDTGQFWWKVSRAGRVQEGRAAGHLMLSTGYVTIGISGRDYRAHRLAWYLVYGTWHTGDIDHKNLIRHDNRIDNLRLATRSQNSMNAIGRGTESGYRGVSRDKKRWVAHIRIDNRLAHLGTFDTPELAYEAVCDAIRRTRGEFARTD